FDASHARGNDVLRNFRHSGWNGTLCETRRLGYDSRLLHVLRSQGLCGRQQGHAPRHAIRARGSVQGSRLQPLSQAVTIKEAKVLRALSFILGLAVTASFSTMAGGGGQLGALEATKTGHLIPWRGYGSGLQGGHPHLHLV